MLHVQLRHTLSCESQLSKSSSNAMDRIQMAYRKLCALCGQCIGSPKLTWQTGLD